MVAAALQTAPVVYARVTPTTLAALAEVEGVQQLSIAGGVPQSETTTADIRYMTRSGALINKGFRGQPLNGIQWQVAVIESRAGNATNNFLATDHVAFRTPSGASRIVKNVGCFTTLAGVLCGPSTNLGGMDSDNSHGTRITAAIAGSIEGGQDPVFAGTNTPDPIRRSGPASEAAIAYYSGDSCAAIAKSIDLAVLDGAQVINMSLGLDVVPGNFCRRTMDCGGVNAALRSALAAGVLVFKSSGNYNSAINPPCSLSYPAWRPEVVSIVSVVPDPAAFASPSIFSMIPEDTTSHGGMSIRYAGGFMETMSAVGLAAPTNIANVPFFGPAMYRPDPTPPSTWKTLGNHRSPLRWRRAVR